MSLESVPGQELTTRAQATERLMNSYLSELVARGDFARYFSDDATIAIMGTDQQGSGRGAVEQAIRYLHQQAFDAAPELRTLFVTDAHAAVEADFVGTHVSEFSGIAATNRQVRLPYSVIYDVADDQITALRIYMSIESLTAQIS